MNYAMPISAGDLAFGERFGTDTHQAGIQGKGHDIGAWRNTGGDTWDWRLTDDADGAVLTNHVVYGKPFYAMASGTVVGAWRNAPENTPGSFHPDFEINQLIAGGGNHLWILQDDGATALYAHAIPGSIPSDLCPHEAALFASKAGGGGSPDIDPQVAVVGGARVSAGQFLGRIGNSGASKGGPHLHVHMENGGQPVDMGFDHGVTTPFAGNRAQVAGPWTALAGNTIPAGPVLMWPPRPVGEYTFLGTPGTEIQSLVDHEADSGMFPGLIWHSDNSNGDFFNSKWVPYAGGEWYWYAGSAAEMERRNLDYEAKGFRRTSAYTTGDKGVAVWLKN